MQYCLGDRREHDVWEERKAKRHSLGKESLPPKSQQAYEQWLQGRTRLLILDKKKQAVVKNPAGKSAATLRRTCLMIHVHPSTSPDDLWVQAGDSKKLMRGENNVKDLPVPEEVDHFTGWLLWSI